MRRRVPRGCFQLLRHVSKPLLLLFAAAATTASADDQEPQSSVAPTPQQLEFFERKVRPLFVNRCYECHAREAKKPQAGLFLDSRGGVLKGGDSGLAIVPGDPDQSRLIQAVRYDSDELQMPPKGKLADAEIRLLEQWVAMGAPMPADDRPGAATAKGVDFAAGRTFWSFQPLAQQSRPGVVRSEWVQGRTDVFILDQLSRNGLHPSLPAERRTLIRRVTFDLIGLPPTEAEVATFVNDDAPDAYVKLVDRLLASPQHGERWARPWLDLARYCDGTDTFLASFGQAYLYRDWVVRAFNADVSYPDFVRRQLAADMLPDTKLEDIPALGFLGLSPTYWKELRLDKEVIKAIVADEWEERIDAIGRTFLGLSIACSRCHDHKFDPIRTEDYYALAGVLASTKLEDRPLLPDAEAAVVRQAREQVKSLQEQMDKLLAAKPVPAEKQQQAVELKARIESIRANTPNFDSPFAHVVVDSSLYVLDDGPDLTKLEYKPGQPQDLHVHVRGNPSRPGPLVPRRFLTALSPEPARPFQQGSGRLELANAIVDEAAPLAARVLVNRIWAEHFGGGLVATPSDFGAQGSRPTHPELLDDLSARFVDSGWSIKRLHREIALSAAYQQSSAHDAAQHALDPENRWLWRMHRRRLAIELWRDAVLTVTGSLDPHIGGPAIELTAADNRRRTLYGTVNRRDLTDMLRIHDFPDPNGHSPKRELTTTPLQQLFVLNSAFMLQLADALATRLTTEASASTEHGVRAAYGLLFGRPPTEREMQLGIDFLTDGSRHVTPPRELWCQYAQVLLGSNEFACVD